MCLEQSRCWLVSNTSVYVHGLVELCLDCHVLMWCECPLNISIMYSSSRCSRSCYCEWCRPLLSYSELAAPIGGWRCSWPSHVHRHTHQHQWFHHLYIQPNCCPHNEPGQPQTQCDLPSASCGRKWGRNGTSSRNDVQDKWYWYVIGYIGI